ncbi:hypothetical protein ACFQES_05710 [Nonomuraea salmonea]|uniref:hypothetical protein n=1 Tax=Nonomuraea salmonea TaxID=46181 RepID=UPI0036210D83
MPSTKRLLATVPAVALLSAALFVPPAAQATSVATYEPTAADFYINYAPPQVEKDVKEPSLTGAQARSLTRAEVRPQVQQRQPGGGPRARRP